jgi:hypothetical protein
MCISTHSGYAVQRRCLRPLCERHDAMAELDEYWAQRYACLLLGSAQLGPQPSARLVCCKAQCCACRALFTQQVRFDWWYLISPCFPSAGEDFNRNLYIPTINFATIHVYRELRQMCCCLTSAVLECVSMLPSGCKQVVNFVSECHLRSRQRLHPCWSVCLGQRRLDRCAATTCRAAVWLAPSCAHVECCSPALAHQLDKVLPLNRMQQ